SAAAGTPAAGKTVFSCRGLPRIPRAEDRHRATARRVKYLFTPVGVNVRHIRSGGSGTRSTLMVLRGPGEDAEVVVERCRDPSSAGDQEKEAHEGIADLRTVSAGV